MALFFAAACCAVVPKVGCDAMGMAVGDVLVLVVLSLCLGFSLWRVVCFVLFHQRFEKVFDSIVGNCGIGFVGRNLRIRILILIVCWFLLEERHVVDKLLELLMAEIGNEGCLVGRVACSFARQVVLHTIAVFDGHQNFEVVVGFAGSSGFACQILSASSKSPVQRRRSWESVISSWPSLAKVWPS